jgi:glutathionylspermidine synthase
MTASTLLERTSPRAVSDSVRIDAGGSLEPEVFGRIRGRMALHCCKWDPQVEDLSVLQPFPLLLRAAQWRHLADTAEKLARETCDAERALLERPDLLPKLGVPRRLAAPVLHNLRSSDPAVSAARVMRFDFHPTPEGWRVSEVNSDVPGGFSEASEFPSLFAQHYPGCGVAGLPGPAYADALARVALRPTADAARVGLLTAAGFMEDLQVVSYLARLLRARDVAAHVVHAHQLRFLERKAHITTADGPTPLSLVVRFHQAEWLARRRYADLASQLLGFSETPVVNPGRALLGESKRLPLVWDELGLAVPTWRRLLPETRHPTEVSWRSDRAWLIKTAYCNTGDSVSSRSLVSRGQWLRAAAEATAFPGGWIAQRRFETCTVDTPSGAMYPCLGVYTIGGRACGVYGRLSGSPVVTYAAADVAVLIREERC